MATPDPFPPAHADLLQHLTHTRSLLSSHARILATSAASPEAHDSRRDVLASLASLTSNLQDLLDAVAAAERDPLRFGLDAAVVRERRGMLDAAARDVESLRREAGRDAAAGGGLPDPGVFQDWDEHDRGGEDGGEDAYEEFERQRQREVWEEQDVALEGVGRTVGNLRMQAGEMGRELEEQGGLVGEVEGVVERVGGKLKRGVKGVEEVARRNEDRWGGCCIGVLIAVLILLLILVIAL